MRTRYIFFITALLAAFCIGICVGIIECPKWATASASGLLALSLLLLYRGVVRPLSITEAGMELLRGQDFSSRLAKVGQADADRIVDLYNLLMEQLKQERLKVQEQNRFLGLLIEASPMGIIICDFDGKPVRTNPAAQRMLTPALQEAVDKMPVGESQTVRLGDNNVFKISRLWFMEMGFRRPFVLIESLTEEVYRAEKEAYGKVIRMIAHEVNNTMAGVKSLLETLADILCDDTAMCEVIDSCRDRCTGMSRFITAYSDVVKIPDAVLTPRDLNECIGRQIPFLEGLTPPGVLITFNPSPSPAVAKVDTVLLEQAIVNIVKNAVESIQSSGSDNGRITISVTDNPPAIDIDDNGLGIDPEIAGRLFTPFLTTKPDGQGIGLLCISEILRRHNCRFSLSTLAPGLTRFSIRWENQVRS